MKINPILVLFVWFTSSFCESSLAQVPGSWEKHVVCTHCSYTYPLHTPPGLIDFADEDHGILIGDDFNYQDSTGAVFKTSTVYITSDGGKTWKKNICTSNSNLWGLQQFRYVSTSFAAGFIGNTFVYSTDQGLNWNYIDDITQNQKYYFLGGRVFSPAAVYKFIAPNKFGSNPGLRPAYIERSTDTGQTFQLISDTMASGNHILWQSYLQDSLNIWAISGDSTSNFLSCLHTTDGGIHWQQIFPVDTTMGKGLVNPIGIGKMIGGDLKQSIYLVNYGIGMAQSVISRFELLFSVDGGLSWNVDSSNHGRLAFVTNAGGRNLWGFIGKEDNNYRFHCDTLAFSPNNGTNWYYDSQTIRGDSVHLMMWKDSVHGYIVSAADSVISFSKYIPPSKSVSSTIKTGNSGIFFRVAPTITASFIHLTAIQSFHGIMSIYDVLGRIFLQRFLNVADAEEKEISVSYLPSGMYFMTFSSDVGNSITRIIKE